MLFVSSYFLKLFNSPFTHLHFPATNSLLESSMVNVFRHVPWTLQKTNMSVSSKLKSFS